MASLNRPWRLAFIFVCAGPAGCASDNGLPVLDLGTAADLVRLVDIGADMSSPDLTPPGPFDLALPHCTGNLATACTQPDGPLAQYSTAAEQQALAAGCWAWCSGPKFLDNDRNLGVEINGNVWNILVSDGMGGLTTGVGFDSTGTVTYYDGGQIRFNLTPSEMASYQAQFQSSSPPKMQLQDGMGGPSVYSQLR